jgi:hypothetical protein
MLEINELEKRWFRYKLKQFIKIFLILFSILVLVITIILTFLKNGSTQKEINIEPVEVVKEEIEQVKKIEVIEKVSNIKISETKEAEIISNAVEKEEKLILKPNLDFLENIKSSQISNIVNEPSQHEDMITSTAEEKIINLNQIQQEVENKSISITKHTSENELKDIIERFNKSKNVALGLFLAKHYYRVADFENAYNYSLLVNELDENIEDSWIIFASSQVKMGKSDQAIAVLEAYIKNKNSQKAKLLLADIKKGAFK